MPLINTQHLDQYLVDISIGSWSLVGRVLTDRFLSINTQCHVCGNLSTLDRLLTECQPSINGDVDQVLIEISIKGIN